MREDLARARATRDYMDSAARFYDLHVAPKRPAEQAEPSLEARAVALSHAIGDRGWLRGLSPSEYLARASVSNQHPAAESGYQPMNARARAKAKRKAKRAAERAGQ